ncbi:hypothetical protein [Pseudoalteromonas sp.]|uniref:hypothetical protein n=1 Tax=Pseudoalteromonas sp. TaxID=53249 RepID=UPI0035677A2F
MSRFINPVPQYKPNSKLYFYKSGTNAQLTTYKDQLETIANTNPVLTDSAGFVPNIFYSGSAKVVVLDEDDVQYIERDPVGGEKELGDFTLWDTVVTYNKNDVVEGSTGDFYISLVNANQGNDPVTNASSWSQINFIVAWNTNQSYATGDIVQTPDGNLWKSLIASNLANDPTVDSGTNWKPAIDVDLIQIPINTVIPQTGGGTLTALRENELRDALTYTLPLANSIDADQTITITLPDEFAVSTPLVLAGGSDTITDSAGADTEILFDSGSITITLTSDGVSGWSL